jgi:hypothetical protein
MDPSAREDSDASWMGEWSKHAERNDNSPAFWELENVAPRSENMKAGKSRRREETRIGGSAIDYELIADACCTSGHYRTNRRQTAAEDIVVHQEVFEGFGADSGGCFGHIT